MLIPFGDKHFVGRGSAGLMPADLFFVELRGGSGKIRSNACKYPIRVLGLSCVNATGDFPLIQFF